MLMPVPSHRSRSHGSANENGFSMVEVIVAMVIFAVMVGGALAILTNSFDVVRANAHRVAAVNLATKQVESARSELTIDIPDGAITRTEIVSGTPYTITQNANYVASGSGTSACVGTGGTLSYKLVTVIVTWPNMDSVKPVRSDTLKALGIGDEGLDPTLGALAVSVAGATNNPAAGVLVTLSPGGQSQTTGIDGCVVFVGLATGATATSTIDYTASVNQPGFVSSKNMQAASVVQAVQGGKITRTQLLYDTERTITMDFDLPPPPPLITAPLGLPLRFRNSYFLAGSSFLPCATAPAGQGCITGPPVTAKHMFPAVYEFWGGSCTDAKVAPDNLDATTADGAGLVPLARVNVTVRNAAGLLQTGKTVTATHAADVPLGGCASGESWSLPNTVLGLSNGVLPYGTWTFSTPGGSSQSLLLIPSTPPGQTVNLVIP